MSEPATLDARAMLARLAVLDMSAAEHVHAKLLAADEPREVAELARSYQRAARSLRQSLGLMARFEREAEAAAAAAARSAHIRAHFAGFGGPDDDSDDDDFDGDDPERGGRHEDDDGDGPDGDDTEGDGPDEPVAAPAAPRPVPLRSAAALRIRTEYDPPESEDLEAELDEVLRTMWREDDFLDQPREAQLDAIIRRLRPPADPDPAAADQPGPDPTPPEPRPLEPGPPDPGPPAPPADPRPPPEPYLPPWERALLAGRHPGGAGW